MTHQACLVTSIDFLQLLLLRIVNSKDAECTVSKEKPLILVQILRRWGLIGFNGRETCILTSTLIHRLIVDLPLDVVLLVHEILLSKMINLLDVNVWFLIG